MLKFQPFLIALLLALVTFPPSIYGLPDRGETRELQGGRPQVIAPTDTVPADTEAPDEADMATTEPDESTPVPEDTTLEEVAAPDTDVSILDIATANPDFETLVTALELAGLVNALEGDGPFTVFAPTNEAFVAAEIEFLLEPSWIKHLQSVLLYHVAEGSYLSSNLDAAGDEIPSLFEEEPINVTSVVPFTVNDVAVATADIFATNGVVHVVEDVLLPAFTELDIVELAAATPAQFSTLVDLLILANLTETLQSGVYTVFAPTNTAFEDLDEDTLTFLRSEEGLETLTDILLYHVSPGIAYADGVEVGDAAESLQGSNITVTKAGKNVELNDAATVEIADILASNGVLHAIDTVLIPPEDEELMAENATGAPEMADAEPETTVSAQESNATAGDEPDGLAPVGQLNLKDWVFLGEEYSTLYELLNATGLTESLAGEGPLTLFAPDNNAFGNLPDAAKYSEPEWYAHLYDILLYHIVPGDMMSTDLVEGMEALTVLGANLTVTSIDPVVLLNDDATVVSPDSVVSNGVAHGLDSVLLPPSAVNDIIDVAVLSPFFAELVGLVVASGLEDAFRGEGPFTFFAPTNNAINSLDDETKANLTSPEGIAQLQRILQYHVVPGIILSDDVSDGQMFETIEGQMLTLAKNGSKYFINNAEILDGDILAKNGVIHGKSCHALSIVNCMISLYFMLANLMLSNIVAHSDQSRLGSSYGWLFATR